MRKFWLAAGLAAVLAGLLAGGLEKERRAEGGAEGALIKDGWRVRLVGAKVAEEVADRSYRAAVAGYEEAGVLDDDPYHTELVGSVAEPLIAAARDLYPQTRDWPWEWHLASTGEVNAYCMSGGRMVVLSGLLADEALGDDRDMLATILAHEVAHAILQHTREGMGRALVAEGMAWTIAKALKTGAVREQEMIEDLKTALLDPKTRARETEADVLGLELMARAGFEPAKAVATWARMADRLSERGQEKMVQRALAFLSDHPSDLDRLARMQALQPKAQPLAGKGRRWEWALDAIDDRQASVLTAAAAAFGIGPQLFGLTEQSGPVRRIAAATGLPPQQAAALVEDALTESGLGQGGVLVMGMRAILRGAGGWERLERIAAAWVSLRPDRALDDGLIKRLPPDDRPHAAAALQRVGHFLASERVARRAWGDLAAELGRRDPRAAAALMARNEGSAK